MTDRKDGGPAFPHDSNEDYARKQHIPLGMSLRDWFAGKAMQGIGTWMPPTGDSRLNSAATLKARAEWAFRQADAMLIERDRDPTTEIALAGIDAEAQRGDLTDV